jgi:hypothetical protein
VKAHSCVANAPERIAKLRRASTLAMSLSYMSRKSVLKRMNDLLLLLLLLLFFEGALCFLTQAPRRK